MAISWKYITLCIVALIAQILIGDFVNIWTMLYVTVFPICIISLPLSINRAAYMLIAFFYGLCIDLLADGVIGLNAAALTALAYTRLFFAKIVLSKANVESLENQPITSRMVGLSKYALLVLFAYAVFFILYILLDSYKNFPLSFVLARYSISVAINTILTIVIDLSLTNKYLR